MCLKTGHPRTLPTWDLELSFFWRKLFSDNPKYVKLNVYVCMYITIYYIYISIHKYTTVYTRIP